MGSNRDNSGTIQWPGPRLGFLSKRSKSKEDETITPAFSAATPAAWSCSPDRIRWSETFDRAGENHRERFHTADELEKGLMDSPVRARSVRNPVSLAKGLHRYSILLQGCEYHLLSEQGDFVLAARYDVQLRRVDIFTSSRSGSGAFARMTYFESLDEWELMQRRCEHCVHKPRQLTCEYVGKGQQLARIRHSKRCVRGMSVHHLDVHLPPVLKCGDSAVWCPLRTGKDLGTPSSAKSSTTIASFSSVALSAASPCRSLRSKRSNVSLDTLQPDEDEEPLQLNSILPKWDEEVDCLVLPFQGRTVAASERNFKLKSAADKEDDSDKDVIFQHAKLSHGAWCIDFQYPLSSVQAFGIALSSILWE